MSDYSSSEDEITKRILKDSIDTDLLTNDLYSNSPSEKSSNKIKSINAVQVKPSLRYIIEDDGHNHNFIKVTPEFQEFVAKSLFKHLESQIIEKKKKHKKLKIDNTDESKGIHLFNGSPKLLFSPLDETTTEIKRKRHLKNTSDEVILQRASETAVSSEWILNRNAVQGWAKVTKGKVMKVKSNHEGTFDIINDEV
ncbi:uncharacterized protein LOC100168536 [Acyrthosiphon pisum]|uniref:Protein CUSTOS n=1 Tax=Acyrthosiphon pisum TaxID=7029 RepID=A0A8R1W5B7_ACYPI|nr:uncharacterized protein LOC100168536 [Acyrthosiphon pisum]XP_008178466.1 uncharacterized protein LOC100168536 [Acyrthosiphon pisum]|eukprot:XP_001951035.1 PREDICTED: uncharacterized protein LOC100168536 [Acyrthosiphon pisum]